MSVMVDQFLSPRRVDHPTNDRHDCFPEPLQVDVQEPICSSSDETCHEDGIYDDFYTTDEKIQQDNDVPTLPQRSALRTSRLLNDLHLKLRQSVESADLSRAMPHHMYMSSEEDASSSADDCSDYDEGDDYDLSSGDAQSSIRRSSHEVTARAVSVIYSGKPSIIELPTRSTSPDTVDSRKRSSTYSSVYTAERTPTPAASTSAHHPARTTSLATVLASKKPSFLKIDPYANGSTYSLDTAKESNEDSMLPRSPRTSTSLFKGASRTLSLVKRKSRPALGKPAAVAESQARPSTPGDMAPDGMVAAYEPPSSPPSHFTSNGSPRVVRKSSIAALRQSPPATRSQTPVELPAVESRRGILSGLAARRRSIRLTAR